MPISCFVGEGRAPMHVIQTDERFAAMVEQLADCAGVEVPDRSRRRFGSDALNVNGSILAMVARGRLVCSPRCVKRAPKRSSARPACRLYGT